MFMLARLCQTAYTLAFPYELGLLQQWISNFQLSAVGSEFQSSKAEGCMYNPTHVNISFLSISSFFICKRNKESREGSTHRGERV